MYRKLTPESLAVMREKVREISEGFAGKTVREVLTSTSNVALATGVASRAILELGNFRDYRDLCTVTKVPAGVGKTFSVPVVTSPTYGSWSEGTLLSAADPTFASTNVTVASFGKNTLVSDLLQNTSAENFIEMVGQVHGGSVRQGIVDKVVDELMGAAYGSNVTVGAKSDGAEASLTLANFASLAGKIQDQGHVPDFLATSPEKFWTAATTDFSLTQFSGAMADFLATGKAPMVMGLETYFDPYFETAVGAWNGTDGEKYAIVGRKGACAAWGQMQDEPETLIERVPGALANYVVTHLDGGASEGALKAYGVILHAS